MKKKINSYIFKTFGAVFLMSLVCFSTALAQEVSFPNPVKESGGETAQLEISSEKTHWESFEKPIFEIEEFREYSFFQKVKNVFIEEPLPEMEVHLKKMMGEEIALNPQDYVMALFPNPLFSKN